MAQGFSSEDTGHTFSKTASGGGSPYLQSYISGDDNLYKMHVINEAINIAQEQRAQKQFELGARRELRNQARENMRLEKHDAIDNAQFIVESELADTDSMNWQDKYAKLMRNHDVIAARSTREGRLAIDSLLKEKVGEHKNYVNWWQNSAKEAGWGGDVRNLPRDKQGRINPELAESKYFAPSRLQKANEIRALQQQQNLAATAAGYSVIPMVDPTGKVTNKLVKNESMQNAMGGKSETAQEPVTPQPTSLPDSEPSDTNDSTQAQEQKPWTQLW